MYVGHFAFAIWAKGSGLGLYERIPLWVGFLLTQLPDLFMCVGTVPLGLEVGAFDVRPVSQGGRTGWTRLIVEYAPYTHGLLGSVIAASAVLALAAARYRSFAMAVPFALLYFSHFACDILVHTKQLHVDFSDSWRIGLGLWAIRGAGSVLEVAMLGWAWMLLRRKLVLRSGDGDAESETTLAEQLSPIIPDILPVVLILLQLATEYQLEHVSEPPFEPLVSRMLDEDGHLLDHRWVGSFLTFLQLERLRII